MQKKNQTNDPSGVPAKENTVHYLRLRRLFSTAWFFRRSNTLFVISVTSNYHELPCISFFPLTPFVSLSRPLQFLQFVTMVTVACRFSSRSLFRPRLSGLRDILFRQEHSLQKKKKKILIVFLHTRLHEQTEKQANRQLLTKKNPLEADSLF